MEGLRVNNMYVDDTIAAISTAPGEGGIGIIRISGSEALKILDKLFKSAKGKDTQSFNTYTIRYGYIKDLKDGNVIDEVLVSYMRAPYTYTREDIVEINCHGGTVPVRRILEAVLNAGARLAEPGEFTKRAFLNGRIDLSQAEAVIDMIRSKTDVSMNAALQQLEGRLSERLRSVKDRLLDIMSHIEASIDFPEEGVDEVIYDELAGECSRIIDFLGGMIKSAETGKILREGLNTVIIGKPNVGKSSLLNALLEENRAIVTDIPGTTRDIIEEYLNIRGIPINIIDTAGIRETNDEVERIGVERTKEYFNKADIIIFVLDSSDVFSDEDKRIFDLLNDKKTIIIINKVDLPQRLDRSVVESFGKDKKIIDISIKTGKGMEDIKDEIYDFVYSGQANYSSEVLVTNIRHKNLLGKAESSLQKALETLNDKLPLDFVSIDIKEALESIGQITGETVQDDIIDRIFSQFCIGK
jgi:tRNA modification GTPase TrmE